MRGGDVEVSKSNRPLGITIIVVFGFLGAVRSLARAVVFLGYGWAPIWISVVLGVIGTAHVVMYYGLWHMTEWGYKLALVVLSLSMVVSLALFIFSPLEGILTLIITGIVLAYIMSKERYFRA